jgi:hypothetical protein
MKIKSRKIILGDKWTLKGNKEIQNKKLIKHLKIQKKDWHPALSNKKEKSRKINRAIKE